MCWFLLSFIPEAELDLFRFCNKKKKNNKKAISVFVHCFFIDVNISQFQQTSSAVALHNTVLYFPHSKRIGARGFWVWKTEKGIWHGSPGVQRQLRVLRGQEAALGSAPCRQQISAAQMGEDEPQDRLLPALHTHGDCSSSPQFSAALGFTVIDLQRCVRT